MGLAELTSIVDVEIDVFDHKQVGLSRESLQKMTDWPVSVGRSCCIGLIFVDVVITRLVTYTEKVVKEMVDRPLRAYRPELTDMRLGRQS